MTEIFFVTSHGWSGSSWFANVLNSHSDIFCSHLMYNRVPGIDDGEEKLQKNNLFDLVRRDSVDRLTTPINEVIVKINDLTNKPYQGNVGLYRARDLPFLIDKFGDLEHKIKIINLVRDPLSVVLSGYGQFQKRFKFDLHELHWNLGKLLSNNYEFISALSKRYGINLGNIQNLSFLAAAQVMASLRLDIDAVSHINRMKKVEFLGHCKLETLTTEKEYFREIIERVVPGLNYSDEYLHSALSTGPINRHSQHAATSASDRFELLTSWQKEAINHFWKLNKLQSFYSSIGYQFEYLERTDE